MKKRGRGRGGGRERGREEEGGEGRKKNKKKVVPWQISAVVAASRTRALSTSFFEVEYYRHKYVFVRHSLKR